MTEYNAVKTFFDGRSDLDAEVMIFVADWMEDKIEEARAAGAGASLRAVVMHIQNATKLDESRARRIIKTLGLDWKEIDSDD
jgi:hypothetical protein